MQSFTLNPLVPDVEISLGLFQNVTNCKHLKDKVAEGSVQMAIVKAEMVVDSFQLLAAASKAFHRKAEKSLKTRTVFTEILFNLSPSNKISECFKLFGVDDNTENIIIVCKKQDSDLICDEVKGDLTNLSSLNDVCNKQLVQSLYKVTDSELTVTSLVNCVVSQMIAKEVK